MIGGGDDALTEVQTKGVSPQTSMTPPLSRCLIVVFLIPFVGRSFPWTRQIFIEEIWCFELSGTSLNDRSRKWIKRGYRPLAGLSSSLPRKATLSPRSGGFLEFFASSSCQTSPPCPPLLPSLCISHLLAPLIFPFHALSWPIPLPPILPSPWWLTLPPPLLVQNPMDATF